MYTYAYTYIHAYMCIYYTYMYLNIWVTETKFRLEWKVDDGQV